MSCHHQCRNDGRQHFSCINYLTVGSSFISTDCYHNQNSEKKPLCFPSSFVSIISVLWVNDFWYEFQTWVACSGIGQVMCESWIWLGWYIFLGQFLLMKLNYMLVIRPGKVDSLFPISHFLDFDASRRSLLIIDYTEVIQSWAIHAWQKN